MINWAVRAKRKAFYWEAVSDIFRKSVTTLFRIDPLKLCYCCKDSWGSYFDPFLCYFSFLDYFCFFFDFYVSFLLFFANFYDLRLDFLDVFEGAFWLSSYNWLEQLILYRSDSFLNLFIFLFFLLFLLFLLLILSNFLFLRYSSFAVL